MTKPPLTLMTWPVVLTRDAGSQASDSGRYNAGIYRAQVLGPDRLILRWSRPKRIPPRMRMQRANL